ncbi:TPA: hypothetical protein ACOTFX_000813 [Clostridium perfringens]|uniref:hypothetical protein n=1 Tax=Clostridium perfringens TaxID=1502 RepID=UPI001009D59A|nr:hypothetical protein [Clostridium perfringens]EJT5939414.1 hypothetical protein [Clostridium perfringens]EJT6471514.1 hypothetical protein [Clostridium perfringens]RXI81521.1 hypothetical protein C6V94_04180 [Clostridium perfringens]RXI84193.1 hypothetical protein C6V96_05675 [Clostridium perfringens]RXI85649.1 hypothetical protein C6V92_05790 [Clostridium perfringens]
MFYREKRKGATLAYVIVVLAIIAVIGTAIVSLSLTNYKAMIVHSKKTQNLYMSESGLDKVQKALDILTAKAITYGNDAVAKEDTSLSAEEDLKSGDNKTEDGYKKISSEKEESQNKIFKKAYKEYIIKQLNPNSEVIKNEKVFLLENNKVKFNNNLIKMDKEDKNKEKNEEGNYDITLIDINNKKISNGSSLSGILNFKTISDNDKKEEISLRLDSKFNVKESDGDKNYKDVSLTFNIEVPDYNGAYKIEEFPLYNVCSNGLVVGENLNVGKGSTLNVDGGIFVSANVVKEKKFTIGSMVNKKEGDGVVINGGTLSVNNGSLVSKNDIRLGGEGSNLKVGCETENNKSNLNLNDESKKSHSNLNNNLGVYTGNLGINGDKIGFDKDVSKGNIISNYPVYAMNDLILNGEKSSINLNEGFYGINSNRTEDKLTGKINNSSAIIVNTDDIGSGSSINIGQEAIIMGTAYINTKPEAYQTGESVSVKGNYIAYTVDNGNVEFKYYNPLQLAKLDSVDEKAKYFKDNIKNAKETTHLEGISLPDNTTSIGATISNNEVKLNNKNATLDNITDISINQVEKYEKAINYIGSLINTKNNDNSEIEFPDKEVRKIVDIKDSDGKLTKAIIYIDSENDKGGNLTIKYGNSTDVTDNEISLGNGIGAGIIVTKKNVILDSKDKSLKFNGTIITADNLDVKESKKIDLVYDDNLIKKIISQNYDSFKNLFRGQVCNNFITIKSQTNMSDNTLNLVKTSNWEVN